MVQARPQFTPHRGTARPLSDRFFTLAGRTHNSGEVQEHIAYSPFGAQTGLTTGSVTFAFGYDGTYTDATTKFQYHSEADTGIPGRWYDPASQGWISQDATGLAPDSNPYRYSGSSPVNAWDPTGLEGGQFGPYKTMFEMGIDKLRGYIQNPQHRARLTFDPSIAGGTNPVPGPIGLFGSDSALYPDCKPTDQFLIGVVAVVVTDIVVKSKPISGWSPVGPDPMSELSTQLNGTQVGFYVFQRSRSQTVEVHERWDIYRQWSCKLCFIADDGTQHTTRYKTWKYDRSAEVYTGTTSVVTTERADGHYIITGMTGQMVPIPPDDGSPAVDTGVGSGDYMPEPPGANPPLQPVARPQYGPPPRNLPPGR